MLRVTAVWNAGPGTPYYTSLYYDGDTSGEATAALAATAAFFNAMKGFTHTALVAKIGPEVEQVDPATGQILAVYLGASTFVGGTAAGDPEPWATQALIRWRTGDYVNGREIRGRTYWPGMVESAVILGVLNTAGIAAIDAAANGHLANANTVAAGGAVIWSPTNGQASLITNASTWEQLAVMRTRRP